MASDQAQKSEAHATTDDATGSPGNTSRAPKRGGDAVPHAHPGSMAAPHGPGASDANSGGGAGAGIPGGDMDMRMGEKIPEGNVEEDGARLFPDSQGDRDESDFGGPARLETDERGNLKD